MESALLIVPVAAGYWVVENTHYLKYANARSNGQRFYSLIALVGIFLVIVVTLFWILFESLYAICSSDNLGWKFKNYADFTGWVAARKHGVLALTLPLGIVTPWLANRSKWFGTEKSVTKALATRDFDLLLLSAFEDTIPVLFTLQGNHLYLGFVVRGPDPESPQSWIRILPLASGYRDSETKKVSFTTFYFDQIANHPKPDDFEVVFRQSEIQSAHRFDIEVYSKFEPDEADKLIPPEL